MQKLRIIAFAASLGLLAACGGTNGEPVSVAQVQSSPIHPDTSGGSGLSKYSPRQYFHRGGSSDDDWIKSPDKSLPNQSLYTASSSRSHLIDHFISNEPPQYIPLTSWKYDFIAGELALDALDLDEARKMFELSLAHAAREKTPASAGQSAMSKARLALIARLAKNYDEAEKLFKESTPTLQAFADEQNYETALNISLYELALINAKKGDFKSSQSYLAERVRLNEKYHGKFNPSLPALLNELGNSIFYQRKFAEADPVYYRALLIASRFTKDSDHTLMASYNLANCRYELGKYADAMELYKRCKDTRQHTLSKIENCKAKLATSPEAEKQASNLPPPIGDKSVWKQLMDSANTHIMDEKSWEARKCLEAALLEARAIGEQSPFVTDSQAKIAELSFQEGNVDEAKKLFEQSLISLKAQKASKESIARVVSQLMLCQLCEKDFAGAENSLDELKTTATSKVWIDLISSIEMAFEKRRLYDEDSKGRDILRFACERCLNAIGNKNSMQRAVALANLARSYGRGDDEKCGQLFMQAVEMGENASDKNPLVLYRIQMNAGLYLMSGQQYKNAEKCLKAALAYAEKNPGKENRQLLGSIELSRALYNNWKKPDEEEALLRKRMALISTDANSPETNANEEKSALADRARIERDRGNLHQAAIYLEKSISLEKEDPSKAQSIIRDLVSIYSQCGRWDKAQFWHEEAAKMQATQSGQEYDKELYDAAVFAAKSGSYEDASRLLKLVISDMESRNETKIVDYGCYQNEPSYPNCVRLLGNCTMDGESNYDKALTIYDKELKVYEPGNSQGGSGDERTRRPSTSPSRNRVELGERVQQPLRLSIEQLTNLLICCDAIGNEERADGYRTQLRARLDEAASRQERGSKGAKNPAHDPAIQLVMKEKRTKDEEIKAYSLIARAMNMPDVYSGNLEGRELLDRAIAWSIHKGSSGRSELNEEYTFLIQMMMTNRRFDEAQPYAHRRLTLLKELNASKIAIASANLDYAKILQERGQFSLAEKCYIQYLPDITSDKKKHFDALKNLSYCLQMQEDYPEAIKYSKLALAKADTKEEKNEMHVRLGTLFDITKQATLAEAEYKSIVPDAADEYSVYEPLRQASDYQAQLKHFQIAELLYRRQAALLGTAPSSALGISNAYSQMARMYKYAKKFDKASQAYQLAITALKTNPTDSSCKSQIQTMEQEMAQMK